MSCHHVCRSCAATFEPQGNEALSLRARVAELEAEREAERAAWQGYADAWHTIEEAFDHVDHAELDAKHTPEQARDFIRAVLAERDLLRGEVMSLRRWRTEQDCRYTLGTVADIDGSHCPSDKPCERCQSERERDRLREALHALCWHAIAWRSNGWVPATGALDDACELVGREALEMEP